MKRIIPVFCLAVGSGLCAKAQLYIDNATFYIESGATVTVQGDLTSNASIQGPGKILLKGTALQNVNMNNGGASTNAYTIPNLEVDNTANVALGGNVRIGTSLTFTNGKVQLGTYNFTLANTATVTGPGTSKFIETNGTGLAQRELTAASSNLLLPIGTGTLYAPISLTHSGGTYASTAVLSAQVKAGPSPNAPVRAESYTSVYWPISSTGVTGGTYSATGTYPGIGALATVTPVETDIYGMSYNGSVWSRTGGAQNYTTKTVTAQLSGNSGQQLYGMNRFLLLSSRVLLQGSYNGTATMNDNLRSGTNVVPTTEPYRNSPYSFTTLDGSAQEVANASVFNDQTVTNDNIVDWVFLELRSGVTSGSTLLQTRSAFVQKDGDVVDVDGVTPVYFKNLDANNFTVTVRHRNHLAISTNNAGGYFKALAIAPSATLDFSTLATSNILGTSNTNYGVTTEGFNVMYAGNANVNNNTRYTGISNDKDFLLATLSSNQSTVIGNTYNQADLNMNKIIRYTGIANDKDFLLSTPLGSNQAAIKSQVFPN